jgi:hypothetical protein
MPGSTGETLSEDPWAVCELNNGTDSPVTYFGYGESPVYALRLYIDDSWRDSTLFWCGTGLGRHTLGSGRGAKFIVPLTRLGVIADLPPEENRGPPAGWQGPVKVRVRVIVADRAKEIYVLSNELVGRESSN